MTGFSVPSARKAWAKFEHDLTLELDLENHCIGDFVSALHSAESFDDAWRQTAEFYTGHELPWTCFVGGMPLSHSIEPAAVFCTVPTEFQDRWVAEKLFNDDPSVLHGKQSHRPILGGAEFLDQNQTSEAVYRFYMDLRSIGSHSSLSVPLWMPELAGPGFIEFACDMPAERFRSFLAERQEILVMAAHYAGQRLSRFARLDWRQKQRLSSRELDCLQWLAKGLRNDRIAEKLQITLPTVKLHLRNARHKLRAPTREAAVATAVFMGLIEP